MKMNGHFRAGECHSLPVHLALGYPCFLETRGADERTYIPKL